MSRVDPYAAAPSAPAIRFLHGLNPLAKIAAPIPAMVLVLFTRDLLTPLVFLMAALVVIIVGASLRWRALLTILIAIPVTAAVFSVTFGLWIDGSRLPESTVILRLGAFEFTTGMWLIGLATALRILAIGVLALPMGLTTTGPDLARSLVQQLRVPYRIGYTAIAAFRFVPRFGHELDVIRAAHRVRGIAAGRSPLATLRRRFSYVIPLLAGAIRHAERVAIAMEARAFGAYPDRTERHPVPFRLRDTVFVLLFWSVCIAVFALLQS